MVFINNEFYQSWLCQIAFAVIRLDGFGIPICWMEITDAIRWMYFLYCCTILDYVSLLITMYFCKENNAFHFFFSRFLRLNLNNLTGHCSLLFCFLFFFNPLVWIWIWLLGSRVKYLRNLPNKLISFHVLSLQKFELKRNPFLIHLMGNLPQEELEKSNLAAKLNSYAAELCPPRIQKQIDAKIKDIIRKGWPILRDE